MTLAPGLLRGNAGPADVFATWYRPNRCSSHIGCCHGNDRNPLYLLRSFYIILNIYTGCPRMNVTYFGRVFLMVKYTDITQNTYVQSLTVTEIKAREV
jgi:hypothetical protein